MSDLFEGAKRPAWGKGCPAVSRHGCPKQRGKNSGDITIYRRRAGIWPGTNLVPENAPLAEPKSTATKSRTSVRLASGFVANGLFCNHFDKPRDRSHHLPGVIDQNATHGLGCFPHEMTSRFEQLLPGRAQIRLVNLPSPLPRRDRPSFVAHCSTSGGLPPSVCQVGSRIALFEACSAFTHVMACMLADSLAEPYSRVLQSKSLPP